MRLKQYFFFPIYLIRHDQKYHTLDIIGSELRAHAPAYGMCVINTINTESQSLFSVCFYTRTHLYCTIKSLWPRSDFSCFLSFVTKSAG